MRGVDRRAAAVPARSGERGVRLPPPPPRACARAASHIRICHLRPPRGARTCSGPGLRVAVGCRGAGQRGSPYNNMTSASPQTFRVAPAQRGVWPSCL